MAHFKSKLLTHLSDFGCDTSGNFSVIAGVSLTLLIAAAGAAIDVGGLASEKSRLQDITDTAALAAASSGETTEDKLQAIVDDIMAEHKDTNREFEYTLSIIDDNITVSANSTYETKLMGMFGQSDIPISTKSGAPVPEEMPINVALVVDTTDSMAGSNMTSLQDAALELVKVIENQKDAGAKMSVVPFGDYVNIGMGNRNASWMDVPADFTETKSCYMYHPVKSKTGCTTTSKTGYKDGVPYNYDREEGCTYEYESYEVEYCPPPKDIEWKGCAGSRNDPLNIVAAASGSTEIPGAMDQTCGSEVLPMTNDFEDVEDAIDGLTTRGNTYLATGLLWGWRTLTPEAPFSNAGVTDETMRAVVFMTDGGNTMTQFDKYGDGDDAYHRTYSVSDDSSRDEAQARMLAICDGIKADGITVFTVGYKLPDGAAGDSTTLEACASSASTAFSADSSAELKAAFKDIGKALAVVRLTF